MTKDITTMIELSSRPWVKEPGLTLGGPHVLVGGADPALRGQIERALTDDGYQVTCTGWDRLERLTAEGRRQLAVAGREPVEALVVDISNNPWTGMMMLDKLRRRDWAMPVFVVSRFITKAIAEEAGRLHTKIFPAPLDMATLLDAVRKIQPPVKDLRCA